VGKFVLLGLGAEAQLVNVIDDFAQVVAALDLVLYLPKDLPDFVFDGVRPARPLRETVQIRKRLLIDEVAEVVAGEGGIVIEIAVLALGRGPTLPAGGLVEDVGVSLPVQSGFGGFVLLEAVKIFQEEEPGRLLGVVELRDAPASFRRTSSILLKACSNMAVLIVEGARISGLIKSGCSVQAGWTVS